MLVIFTSLAVSLLLVLFSLYSYSREIVTQEDAVKVYSFFNKGYNRLFSELKRFFLPVGGMFAVLGLVQGVFHLWSFRAGLALFLGAVFSFVVIGFGSLFTAKVFSKTAHKTDQGLIDTFYSTLWSGNIAGIFFISSGIAALNVLFIILRDPRGGIEAGTLVSFVLGVVSVLYLLKHLLKTEDGDAIGIRDTVLYFVGLYGNTTMAVLAGIVVTSLVFPESSGVVVLPILLVAVALIAVSAAVKLIKIGSTTNLKRNYAFVFVGSVLLTSILSFPLFVWILRDAVHVSFINLWLTAVLGYAAVYVIGNIKNLTLPLFFLFISLSIGLSLYLGGLYGFTVFVIAFISFSGLFSAVKSLSGVTAGVYKAREDIDLEEERIRVLEKLQLLKNTYNDRLKTYMFLSSSLVLVLLYLVYTREAATTGASITGGFGGLFLGFALVALHSAINVRMVYSTVLYAIILVAFVGAAYFVNIELYSSIFAGIVLYVIAAGAPGIYENLSVKIHRTEDDTDQLDTHNSFHYSGIVDETEISFAKIATLISLLVLPLLI